jgi:hypothetical protein
MSSSSYQAQQVLAELRKRLGLDDPAAARKDTGAVRVSTITIIEDEEPQHAAPVAPRVVTPSVADQAPLPPAVDRELERRAGSFMQPPVSPPPVPPIPKLRAKPPVPPPRKRGEAD